MKSRYLRSIIRTCRLWLPPAAAALLPALALAQTFGSNKVQWHDFDFQVLETEHFDIYHYPESREAINSAAVMAERWNRRLSGLLDFELPGRQPLIMYTGAPHFRQSDATPGEIGVGTGGFTEIFKRRIVMPFAGPLGETDHVLGHELVHAFQYEMAGERSGSTGSRMSASRLPLWFIEGMAEYLSLGSRDSHTAMWMRDAIVEDDLPTLRQLDNAGRYFPYRFGHAFWAYVGGRWGDDVVRPLLRAAGETGNVTQALEQVLGIEAATFEQDWHNALRETFGPQIDAAGNPEDYGRLLVEGETPLGRYNVGPALSPDGRRLAFFSERDVFSIELFLLDVESGEVIRRLTRTATDPHYDSMQFLQSAGSWSPDGDRFAFAGISRGRPVLTIIDADSGETVAEHRFDNLVEIFNPSWSPDGSRIAFSANEGGVSDLFVLDLASGETARLTDDDYADLQPDWAPDGSRLAFVSDRFTSEAGANAYGGYRLAAYSFDDGGITELPGPGGDRNFNPQWSQDGRFIYFVADAAGTGNVYRLDLESGASELLTNLKTGVSGISQLSPALSVAGGQAAMSVFSDGIYHIYLMEDIAGSGGPERTIDLSGAQLPPAERADSRLSELLGERAIAADDIRPLLDTRPYNPSLSLDYVAPPNIGVGVSNQSTYFSSGIGVYWSDMLGEHNLMTAVQLEGEGDSDLLNNLGLLANYENRSNRWTWGGTVGQIPLRSSGYNTFIGNIDGQQALIQQRIRQWQINREATGRIAYPFDRARRVEFSLGARNIAFESDLQTRAVSLDTGGVLVDRRRDLPSPDSLNFATAGAAFVSDTSVFGPAGPVAGERYRVELSGNTGDLDFLTPLIDYRRYYQLGPSLSLAGRFTHFGRYGEDGEDSRLQALFLGNSSLVRGYSGDSFIPADCQPALTADTSCAAFEQLLGSRIAVANLEARSMLVGPAGLLYNTARIPPISAALFYDAGAAWSRGDDNPRFGNSDKDIVRSVGASLRLNFGGGIQLQWTYANPLDRARSWHWEFSLTQVF